MSHKEKENALNEVRLLASIEYFLRNSSKIKRHENIIAYKDAFLEDCTDTLCMVMEYADAGDLYHYLQQHSQNKKLLTEKRIWQLFTQIVKGLKVLHDQKILHRDIKSSNIFLTKAGYAKLGDLNVSKICEQGMLRTQTGTPYYASPEVWQDKPYDYRSDLWSLGCVLYEMCTLKPPFRENDMRALHSKIVKGVYAPIPKTYSNELIDIVKGLLQINPLARPSLSKLMESPSVAVRLGEKIGEENKENCALKPPLKHGVLLDTIKLPRNLRVLKDKLPGANYGVQSSRGRSVERKKTNLSCVEETRKESRESSRGPERRMSGKNMPKEFDNHMAKGGKAAIPPCGNKFIHRAIGKENIDPCLKMKL